jgi:hypothetical protein
MISHYPFVKIPSHDIFHCSVFNKELFYVMLLYYQRLKQSTSALSYSCLCSSVESSTGLQVRSMA